MRIYGPADILSAAGTVRQGLNEGADQVRELVELVPRVVALVARAEALLDEADALVERSEQTRAGVQAVTDRAEQLVERTERLMEPVEELAPKAMPIANSVVDHIDPAEVAAINGLMNRLPSMLDQIDHIGPDVNRILDAVTDLTAAMQGMPGMKALKRRGEKKAEDEDEETPGGHERA